MGLRSLLAFGFVALLVASAVAGFTTRALLPVVDDGVGPPSSVGDGAPGAAPATEVTIAPGYSLESGTRELGAPPVGNDLSVVVGLAPRDPAGLASYLTQLYTPGTSEYRHYLTPSMLAERFGASTVAVRSAVDYFRSFGLTATASPDDLTIDVAGPITGVGAAFHTSFEEFEDTSGREFVSHLSPAVLPGIVPWSGALGLGNVSAIRPDLPPTGAETPLTGPAASCVNSGYLAPCQVWGAYDLADDLANGTDGAGLTIAVVDTYSAAEPQSQLASDLASFDTQFGLPAATVHYLYPVPTTVDLNTSNLGAGWEYEEALDLEWAHAAAPGATIDMTFSPNPDVGLYEAIDDLVAGDRANVISLSWGEPDVGVFNAYSGPCASACNASTDGSYAILSPVLEFAAAEGISVFAATGDCGSADGTSGVATNFPASDPYVTAVGGTDLTVSDSGVYESETGWSGNQTGATSPGCMNQGGSGGGYSPFPRPYWQSGPGLTAGTTRATPDVAAIATPAVEIFENGNPVGVVGTSVATPIWAGIAAIADQAHGAALGFLNPQLYAILRDSAEYTTDFHEITSGNNGYRAGPDWNAVTGIGSPVVGALVSDLAPPPTTDLSNLTVELNASTVAGPAPLAVTFFENDSGGSGGYPLSGVYFGDGTAGTAIAGQTSHVYAASGVYAAQGYAFDSSGNDSDSIPLAIVVGGGSTLSVGFNVSNPTPAAGTSVAFTANATGGTPPYTYDYWFGDGTFLNGSTSPVVDHTYLGKEGYCAVVIVVDAASPPDGGESTPVAIAAGGAAAPSCSIDRGDLHVTAASGVPVRDAPADFSDLFQVTGGEGSFAEQWVASDPYVAACECTIFRAAGTFSVALFVNSTTDGQASAATTVTVAPPLNATFAVGPTFGTAPLTVDLTAAVSGGYGANATTWDLGNGGSASGTAAQATYATPGTYWLVGHVADRGDGNASEAFLIDVTAAAGPALAATIRPAIDVTSGTTVRFSANVSGGVGSASFDWDLGDGGTALAPSASRTFDAVAPTSSDSLLTGSVDATEAASDWNLSVGFSLGPFFAVEPGGFVPAADALALNDSMGPLLGVPPLEVEGNATATGPGLVTIAWSSGAGPNATGPSVRFDYLDAGSYTATVEATDSFGDVAWDAHGVDAGFLPIGLEAGPSTASGAAPLVVMFTAFATGSEGPFDYAWQFGDGGSASVGNVSHTYVTPGTFVAELAVRASDGHTVEANYTIVVSRAPSGAPPWSPFGASLAEVALAGGVATAVVLAAVARGRRRAPSP
jgi:PKD repeat protein